MESERRRHAAALKDLVIGEIPEDPDNLRLPSSATHTQRAKVKLRKLREKREGAQTRNDLELPEMPGINALSFTVRYLHGGRQRFLEFVKLAHMNGDPVATAWWTVFADLPKTQREHCNFDDVCAAAGVKPSALLAGVVGHGMEAMTDMGNLVAAAFHPEVVAAAGKSALRIGGEHASVAADDRKQLLQARGLLPVPKGASIHVHANASANAAAAAQANQDPSVPKFSSDIASLSASREQVQKRLAETPSTFERILEGETIPETVEG